MAPIGRKNCIEEAFRRRRFKGLVAFKPFVPRHLPAPFHWLENLARGSFRVVSGISERAIVNGLETIFASGCRPLRRFLSLVESASSNFRDVPNETGDTRDRSEHRFANSAKNAIATSVLPFFSFFANGENERIEIQAEGRTETTTTMGFRKRPTESLIKYFPNLYTYLPFIPLYPVVFAALFPVPLENRQTLSAYK